MTDAELNAIRARADAATGWRFTYGYNNGGSPTGYISPLKEGHGTTVEFFLHDADFLSTAKPAILSLLAEVERLKELAKVCDDLFRENDQLIEERDRLQAQCAAFRAAMGDGPHSFCPECGPNVRVDEDGLCGGCGATALGAAVDKIRFALFPDAGTAMLERLRKLEAVAEAARKSQVGLREENRTLTKLLKPCGPDCYTAVDFATREADKAATEADQLRAERDRLQAQLLTAESAADAAEEKLVAAAKREEALQAEAAAMRRRLRDAACAMTTDPRDWARNPRDAWLYGVIVGWNDLSLRELSEKFKWSEKTVDKLRECSDSSDAGTALLERVRKLEAVADAVRSFGTVEVPQQIYDALAALDGEEP